MQNAPIFLDQWRLHFLFHSNRLRYLSNLWVEWHVRNVLNYHCRHHCLVVIVIAIAIISLHHAVIKSWIEILLFKDDV